MMTLLEETSQGGLRGFDCEWWKNPIAIAFFGFSEIEEPVASSSTENIITKAPLQIWKLIRTLMEENQPMLVHKFSEMSFQKPKTIKICGLSAIFWDHQTSNVSNYTEML